MARPYDFKALEAKWQQIWEERRAFRVTEDPAKPKYYCLEIIRYTPADLKVINTNLQQVLREVRGDVPPPDDAEATRKKNLRMQRLNQAILMLTNYCRQQRISL